MFPFARPILIRPLLIIAELRQKSRQPLSLLGGEEKLCVPLGKPWLRVWYINVDVLVLSTGIWSRVLDMCAFTATLRKFRGKDVFRERSLTTRSEERRFYSQVIDYFMYAQIPGFDGYYNHTQLFFHH